MSFRRPVSSLLESLNSKLSTSESNLEYKINDLYECFVEEAKVAASCGRRRADLIYDANAFERRILSAACSRLRFQGLRVSLTAKYDSNGRYNYEVRITIPRATQAHHNEGIALTD